MIGARELFRERALHIRLKSKLPWRGCSHVFYFYFLLLLSNIAGNPVSGCFFIYKYTIQDIIIFCFSLSRCLYACYKSFFGLSNLFMFHGSQCSDNCIVTAYKCFSCYCQMMLNMNISFFSHVCKQRQPVALIAKHILPHGPQYTATSI